ncbi:MAG: helix-turn-helix transcriptional regulator [Prevotella sp.]|nr:helix-turn-helix transcriptional regulator [Bacteroides sp.]MCM1365992.1 helix-turn-helix transcriptional regulator [Prevotella sp.]MCM1437345.1 helix-turn-helix transcriptional regulator [Prevotella sp.]
MIKDSASFSRYDRLRDIVKHNNGVLMVMCRFGISLGFGDDNVEDICTANDVDTDTFLAVINMISGKPWGGFTISIPALMEYLKKSHIHFTAYSLPLIKKLLIEGIHQTSTSEISIHIMHFFEKYVEEVNKYMDYEGSKVFSYINSLLEDSADTDTSIMKISSRQENIAHKLDDLEELFVYQYKQQSNEMINTALLHIMTCRNDLEMHFNVEHGLLFPAVVRLEESRRKRRNEESLGNSDRHKTTMLSDREREIIRWVAHGLSNKEIADKLTLSFHTVTTYRRNISEKLNIHSSAALAIFAVVHNIVDINEVNPDLD